MAFATYNATTGAFGVTTGFTANDDYLVYNNTECALRVDLLPDSDGSQFNLGPGEVYVYHHSGATVASAANAVVGRPLHTAVGATAVVNLSPDFDGSARPNESQARLVVTGF